MRKDNMSWKEIILGVFMLLTGIPDIEEVIGQFILDNSTGNPSYWGIWLGVKLLPVFGLLALVDGIARQFGSNLWKLLIKVKKKWSSL